MSVCATATAGVATVVHMGAQVYLGITEGTIGEAGVGLDYGGVGGGLWGFDVGLFQVGWYGVVGCAISGKPNL